MLSLEDARALERWEDSYLAEPEENYEDEDEYWNRADDDAEEMWFQRIREEGL